MFKKIRRSLGSRLDLHLFREPGVSGYLLKHMNILRLIIRSALPAYDLSAGTERFTGLPVAERESDKTIWSYWDQGVEQLPIFNRLCVATWQHHNPGWSIVLLDRTNLFDFLDADEIPQQWKSFETPQSRADLIRIALLQRYGGVWMDTSILLQQSLDRMVWDRMITESLDIAGFSIRRFSRCGGDDVFESWFIASRQDGQLIRHWHQALSEGWAGRVSTRGIIEQPLFESVDLKRIDAPEYLHLHSFFQAIIQKNPQCKKAFEENSYVIAADDTGFRWQDRHGFNRLSALALLGSEYSPEHFADSPLLKFTGWPATQLYARFSAGDLLDQRHTLGQLFRRNTKKDIGSPGL